MCFFVFFLSQFLLSESVNAGGRANVAVAESELEGEVRRGGEEERGVFVKRKDTSNRGFLFNFFFLYSLVLAQQQRASEQPTEMEGDGVAATSSLMKGLKDEHERDERKERASG